MQPCQSCGNESAVCVCLALLALVGVAALWRTWPGKSWRNRLMILLGCAGFLVGGTAACLSRGPGQSAEPASPPSPAVAPLAPAFAPAEQSPAPPPPPVAKAPTSKPTAAEAPTSRPAPQVLPAEAQPVAAAQPPQEPQVIVYYFHRKVRCHSCLQIEEWARRTVETQFTTPLATGLIEWRRINVEEPGNEHFTKDYKLEGPSLVMVPLKEGKPGSWKNLEKVWEYLGDQSKFTRYVQTELSGSLDPSSAAPKP